MQHKIIHLAQTASTNDYLRALPSPQDDCMTVVYADWQTAGRGQGSNKWESEAGKNLLFSILVCPTSVDITRQFVLSMAGALAVKAALDKYTDGISLKWPNDIYWHDRKISGTLIETSVKGRTLARCIYGIGLNVNQREFHSDAPNPVSLYNRCRDSDRTAARRDSAALRPLLLACRRRTLQPHHQPIPCRPVSPRGTTPLRRHRYGRAVQRPHRPRFG